jgi:hypothetical protein
MCLDIRGKMYDVEIRPLPVSVCVLRTTGKSYYLVLMMCTLLLFDNYDVLVEGLLHNAALLIRL